MDRLLVTGGNGLLGTKLLGAAQGKYQVTSLSRSPLTNRWAGEFTFCRGDITDPQQVESVFAQARPDAVIHSAAMTDVDGCETQRDQARLTNVVGTENVAKACARSGAHLLYLSTDYIFDGRAGPYREVDPPAPLSFYARTKLEGEQMVQGWCPQAAIARTSVLYGYAPNVRGNFVLWVVAQLGAGKEIRIVTDQAGSPTWADHLAEVLLMMVDRRAQGVYHTAGRDGLSRFAFAQEIAQVFGLDASNIRPITSQDLAQPALRPANASLCVEKVEQELGIGMLGVRDGLMGMRQQWEEAQR